MKKTGICIAMLFFVSSLLSQPVLNNSLNFTIGDTYRIDGYYDVTVIDPGGPGANKAWDFEEIEGGMFIEGEPAICVDPATTPFADSTAAGVSQICTKSQNTGELGPYEYFHTTGSFSHALAIGWYEEGNTSYGDYEPSYNYLNYPLSYGDSYDFSYDYMSYHLDLGYHYYRDSSYVQIVADAWGSIITPLGTFPNVLRLKVTTLEHSWYRFEAGEPWTYTGEFVTTSYQWFAPNIKVPLMNIQMMEFAKSDFHETIPKYCSIPLKQQCFGGQQDGKHSRGDGLNIVQYLADYDFTTGIDELSETGFVVYPNPAKTSFHIQNPKGLEANSVVFYDNSGRVVFKRESVGHSINGLTLSPGLYVVEIESGSETMRTKLIIQ
jgi:hypothetical protein